MSKPAAVHYVANTTWSSDLAGLVSSGAIELHRVNGGNSVNGLLGSAGWNEVTCRLCLRHKPAAEPASNTKTLRQLIAELGAMTELLDQPVAYTIWFREDLELWIDEANTITVWPAVAEHIQEHFESEWFNHSVNDEISTFLADQEDSKQ